MVVSKETREAIDNAVKALRDEFSILKTSLENRLSAIDEENSRLKADNADLKKKLNDIESNNQTCNKPLFSSFIKKISAGAPAITDAESRVFNAISAEQKEKIKKEKNVIIFGLIESARKNSSEKIEDDKVSIDNVFDAINLDKTKIVRHFRLKSKDTTKPGPLVVELIDSSYQKQVLSVARDLSKTKFKEKVYINQDLTYRERASLKVLLEERKKLNKIEQEKNSPFRYIIRNDMLDKIEIKH